MIITITVEHEGKKPNQDYAIRETLTAEQIDQCGFDLVCDTVAKLRSMIQQAIDERHA